MKSLTQQHALFPPLYNYFYNGHWHIDQVNEGAAYTVAGGAGIIKCMDGLNAQAIGAGTFTVQQVTDPNNAAKKACKIVCTVADASIAAGDLYYVEWPLEGSGVTDLQLGTATAKSITIKFDASSVLPGTYGISISNSAKNRVYVGTIAVTATSVPQIVTLQLDTSGTWLYAAATVGMRVRLCLAAGSTYQGTLGAWGTSDIYTTSAQANFMATATTNIIYIKPIQLVEGTVAGDIMPETYDEALFACQLSNGFLPRGTSAVAHDIASKFNETISVFDFMTPAQITNVQAASGAGGVDVTAAVQAAVTFACSFVGSTRLYFPSGIYLLSSAITIPDKSQLVMDALAATFIGVAGSNNGFVITDGGDNHYYFGRIESTSSGACILIQPSAAGGGANNTVVFRSLYHSGGYTGYGLRVNVTGGSRGWSVGRIIGADCHGFAKGISFEVDTATNNIDTVHTDINYVYDNSISIYLHQNGGSINSNRWNINYEASFSGSIGFQSNSNFDVIKGTVLAASGSTLNQLDSGAKHNQFYLTPPPANYDGTTNFPGSTYAVDNSGNTSNKGLYGTYVIRASVHRNGTAQTGIVTATYTKISWTTEEYDDGSVFASDKWTPGQIGKARISARVGWTNGMADISELRIAVYKNGSIYKETIIMSSSNANGQGSIIDIIVPVNTITDYFEIYARQATGGNVDIIGAASNTWATFEMIDS